MPVLASHRKPRSTRSHSPAVGVTTAALAGVTLLTTQSAQATPAAPPKPTVEEIQKKVDDLYRQAGTATQEYNRAKETTDQQRRKVDGLLDDVAKRTDEINESRRALGSYAAAQYRAGAVGPTAALIFADSPQSYFDQTHLMDRLTERQRSAVTDYEGKRLAAAKQRAEATKSLETLTESQATLRTTKQTVQRKLGEARTLLARLTAEEKARLEELERKRQAEARRKAEAQAKAEAEARAAEAERRRQAEAAQEQQQPAQPPANGGSSGSTYAAKAEKALSFARAQIGKPYVWGATGPSSYDCSGLTQAAWKAAGVDLPRTTWDQVEVGTRVATADLLPGDLVFFYDDISHVGLYIGGGKMIHAPKPGANVREESIYYMPIYGSIRPA
ncbi:NlpC/P60 family protein [Streptomyces sp. Je 1-79]|uniref:C40 family peptidase n=1 Tax=Streptomyces sp. Je 1-79 TaxID=2943847 RepID=UPI0021A4857D|nr:NlpC/P60 family protein [Streptomyces sp. Je 1-79]MCT4355718.1 NlpC/P60 family protein [Streptomyces sp. Je 1-79]